MYDLHWSTGVTGVLFELESSIALYRLAENARLIQHVN